jgi:hypothetical protein
MKKLQASLLFLLIAFAFSISSCSEDEVLKPVTSGIIEGIVTDTSGLQPIASVSISTQPVSSAVTTNAEGKYKIENVLPGTYIVSAEKINVGAGTVTVSVLAGKTTTANIVLIPEGFHKGSLTGIVVDKKTGMPLEGVTITTIPETSTIVTGASGSFLITDIDEGTYAVTATKNGLLSEHASVEIEGGKATHLTIEMAGFESLPGVLAYYPLQDGSGEDVSGNELDGMSTGVVAVEGKDGVASGAAHFESDLSEVVIPHSGVFNQLPLSIMFWLRSDQVLTTHTYFLNKYFHTSGNGYAIFFENGKLAAVYGANSFSSFTRSDVTYPADNKWHLVSCMIDDTGIEIFVDTVSTGKKGWTGLPTPTNTTEEVIIGAIRSDFSPVHFIGDIDEVQFFDRILTKEEIIDYFN